MKHNIKLTLFLIGIVCGSGSLYSLQAQEINDATQGGQLEEIQVIGSRSNRSSSTSPVPVDIIDVAELADQNGRVEITQLLQYAAPSFNATKQSGSDGADHIVPASLRGLGPDQTLLLVNGKRRHQTSLVNIFGTRGNGNTGSDLNALPISSIKRIEVLRDGASAQYGSDAIAGVINVVLKDESGFAGGVTYGAYSTNVGTDYAEKSGKTIYNVNGKNRLDGQEKGLDGNIAKVNLGYGMKLGKKGGFVHVSTEFLAKDRTLRPGFSWRKGYGSAAVDQFQFMVNAALPLSDNTKLYAFGGRSDRDTDAYAFTRGGASDARSVQSLYPNGFSPHITSQITDNAAVVGIEHTTNSGWKLDFAHDFGANKFHYYIDGTNNASLGDASPTFFDAGGHSLNMNVTSLDITKLFENVLSGLNLAFGTEYRTENFQIFAGEEASYAIYDTDGLAVNAATPANKIAIYRDAIGNPILNDDDEQQVLAGGSQGFPGYKPDNAINAFRSNYGLYADAELNFSKKFMFGAAVRFERYSDFGNTFNYKLALRYAPTKSFALRASTSSGFRAPSLVQIHYNLVFNNIVQGTSIRTLLASNTSTVAKSFGIGPLKQETAQNYAAGVTYTQGGFTATIDGYIIDVKDRIILTSNFDATSLNQNVDEAQFFANGVDTRTLGLDFVLAYKKAFSKQHSLGITVTGNFNGTEIRAIKNGKLKDSTFFGSRSQSYLKAAAPNFKYNIGINYAYKKLGASLVWTQYSAVQLEDDDGNDDAYASAGTIDLSLNYSFSSKFMITLGSNNLLNVYPSPQYDGATNQGGFNDSVQMGADGAYFFVRVSFNL